MIKGTDLGNNSATGPRRLRILTQDPMQDGARYRNHRSLLAKLRSFADAEGIVRIPHEYQLRTTIHPTTSARLLFNGLVVKMAANGDLIFEDQSMLEVKGARLLLWLRRHRFVGWERLAEHPVRKFFRLGQSFHTTRVKKVAVGSPAGDHWISALGYGPRLDCEIFAALVKTPVGRTVWNTRFNLVELEEHGDDPLFKMHEIELSRKIAEQDPHFKVTERNLIYTFGLKEE